MYSKELTLQRNGMRHTQDFLNLDDSQLSRMNLGFSEPPIRKVFAMSNS